MAAVLNVPFPLPILLQLGNWRARFRPELLVNFEELAQADSSGYCILSRLYWVLSSFLFHFNTCLFHLLFQCYFSAFFSTISWTLGLAMSSSAWAAAPRWWVCFRGGAGQPCVFSIDLKADNEVDWPAPSHSLPMSWSRRGCWCHRWKYHGVRLWNINWWEKMIQHSQDGADCIHGLTAWRNISCWWPFRNHF